MHYNINVQVYIITQRINIFFPADGAPYDDEEQGLEEEDELDQLAEDVSDSRKFLSTGRWDWFYVCHEPSDEKQTKIFKII